MPWQMKLVVGFLSLLLVEKALLLLLTFSGGGIASIAITTWVLVMMLQRKRDGLRIAKFLMGFAVVVNAGLAAVILSGVLPIEPDLVVVTGVEAVVVALLSLGSFFLLRDPAAEGWCYRE